MELDSEHMKHIILEQIEDIDLYEEELHNQLKLIYSYEYMEINEKELALSLLNEIPKRYFKKDINKEIQKDSNLKFIFEEFQKMEEILVLIA